MTRAVDQQRLKAVAEAEEAVRKAEEQRLKDEAKKKKQEEHEKFLAWKEERKKKYEAEDKAKEEAEKKRKAVAIINKDRITCKRRLFVLDNLKNFLGPKQITSAAEWNANRAQTTWLIVTSLINIFANESVIKANSE